MKIILPVKPISQLFPIPFVMGCEGVSAAMLLQFNNYDIKATQIMSHWPKHPTNPYKGYVGHPLLVKFGHHQTIFPDAFAPFLKQYDSRIVDGTGTSLNQLEKFIDKGQPVIIYHTSLGSKPLRRVFHFDNQPTKLVSNIHVTLLIGMMMTIIIILIRYGVVYQNLLFSHLLFLTLNKSLKLKSTLWKIVIMPQEKMHIYRYNNKASRDCLNSVSRGFIK